MTPQTASDDQPRLRVLSPERAQAIHEASLQVLKHVGYHMPVAEARELLAAAGARVVGERVYVLKSWSSRHCRRSDP
jgi:trimethylamine:corrinoid methyltransferase-like protein